MIYDNFRDAILSHCPDENVWPFHLGARGINYLSGKMKYSVDELDNLEFENIRSSSKDILAETGLSVDNIMSYPLSVIFHAPNFPFNMRASWWRLYIVATTKVGIVGVFGVGYADLNIPKNDELIKVKLSYRHSTEVLNQNYHVSKVEDMYLDFFTSKYSGLLKLKPKPEPYKIVSVQDFYHFKEKQCREFLTFT